MSTGVLPDAASEDDRAAVRHDLQSSIMEPYASLRSLPVPNLTSFVDAQRQLFSGRVQEDDAQEQLCPDDPSEPLPQREQETQAYFVPSGKWQRPSDYVAH
eukprot:2472090-Karenia_brevis.AAC.1